MHSMHTQSTETALSDAVDIIESGIYRKKQVLAVSLDCSGAFDRINFESARMAMDRKGIDPAIVAWYGKLLKGRKITAHLQGEKCCLLYTSPSPRDS